MATDKEWRVEEKVYTAHIMYELIDPEDTAWGEFFNYHRARRIVASMNAMAEVKEELVKMAKHNVLCSRHGDCVCGADEAQALLNTLEGI